MDYIKYNCYDLAAQNATLHKAYGKLRNLSEELAHVISALDPQIKSYEGLQGQLAASGAAAADIVARFTTAYNALDQIIDIYYAADNKIKQTAEDLPSGIAQRTNSTAQTSVAPVQMSTINNSDLILEDWLAELLYKIRRRRKIAHP